MMKRQSYRPAAIAVKAEVKFGSVLIVLAALSS